MLSFARKYIQRDIGAIVVALCIIVGGTWAIMKVGTDHIVDQYATRAASDWARYLVDNVSDLEYIASGERPSAASMTFFEGARKASQVLRYEIFNRQGYSQIVADHERVAPLDIANFSEQAVRAVKSGELIVETHQGTLPGEPAYFAQAFIPVFVDGRPIGVVAAYVDQTGQRDTLYRTAGIAAAALCLLMAFAFGVPAIAWQRRTREKQQADRRIRFLAHHDPLTSLANREQLKAELDRALGMIAPGGTGLAVHFLDLDHFKEVNDTLGHDGGDFLLQTVADRLRTIIRADDIVARLGGDEFVVVQTCVTNQEQAIQFAQRFTAILNEPVVFKEQEIIPGVSVGIAVAPQDGATAERLLKCADLALYKSKAEGRNCARLFRPEMDVDLQARVKLERAVRDAVLHDGFQLHYQPLFEMAGRRLIGFEALIRLPQPDGTFIPPMTFIPIAEEIRLINKIGAWVMREACMTAATWPDHLTVAVNLSPSQFAGSDISGVVEAALKESGLTPNRLELEVTETLLLGDSEAVLAELQKLKAMGVSIAMDDFGTGYSSLSYLWRFPFDKIKIDRSFMQGFEASGRDAEMVVKTIIALGRELDMRVTVEGVETTKQVEFLDAADGDQVQGFYFGRPMAAADVAEAILANTPRRGWRQLEPVLPTAKSA